MKKKLTLIFITAFTFLFVSCDGGDRVIREMLHDQKPNKEMRDAAAEELGGVKEAMKNHYWNGQEWVGGPAPSQRAHKAAKKLGLGSEKEARKTHDWNYSEWVPKDK
jgi:hypothetical protein